MSVETSKERKASPDNGHTLVVNGIGTMAASLAERFLRALDHSGGRGELLGVVSLSNIPRSTEARVKAAMGSFVWRLLNRPSVLVDDIDATVKAVQKASEKHGGSARAMLHFISFERKNTEVVGKTLDQLKGRMADLLHVGVLVMPDDPIRKIQFQRGIENTPLDRFPIPVMVIDQAKCREQDREDSLRILSTEDAFLYGLAGLVSARRVFPHLNIHSYQELLEALTEKSPFLGVAVASGRTFLQRHWGFEGLFPQALESDAIETVASSLSEESLLTPFGELQKPSINVVVAQLPLHYLPHDRSWTDGSLAAAIGRGELYSPSMVTVYTSAHLPEVESRVPIVAMRLFPGVLK